MTTPIVAHVLSSFDTGGQERVALALASEQRRRGHRVIAVSLGGPRQAPIAEELRAEDVAVRSAPKRLRLDPGLPLALARLFRRDGVDLVHTHNPLPLIYAAPAARLAGAAVVHTKHGRNPGGSGARALRRFSARLVHSFVAVSEETAIEARDLREVDPRKLRVIMNGIDVERFAPDREARGRVRRELGIPENAWVVGALGRMDANKNQAALLEALAPYLGSGMRLVLAGDGPLRGELEDAAAILSGRAFIHLAGWREDVPALLAALDVFALPSRTEGLPLVVLEAMASGLPVLASAVGGLPSVIEEGRTGFLLEAGDAIALRGRLLELFRDRDRAARMGERGRERARELYGTGRMAKDYRRVYNLALGKKHGSS